MTPTQIIVVPYPIPVAGQTWSKRTPQPQYSHKPVNRWPLTNTIPTDEARRRMLDVARQRVASEREGLKRLLGREDRV
jgi:hypothetical protein